jgi:prepilin-type N-terminal cleavage/methylation domain-containing protein
VNRRGVTIIELIVVLTLVGILANIAIPRYEAAKRDAQAVRVVTDFNVIRTAAYSNFVESGTYPANAGWGVVPPALVASLPAGFQFSYGGVDYRWRRWSLPNGMPKNKKQTVLVGLDARTSDKKLMQAIQGLYRGQAVIGSAKKVTFVIE